MNRKLVLALALTLLVGLLSVAFNVQRAKATGTIYIRADGSVDPPTAPITTVDNATYTFTDNINDSIVVGRDNIVIDGNGHVLQAPERLSDVGLDLSGRKNVTVKNMEIREFRYGIMLVGSSNNSIVRNNIGALPILYTGNEYGIYLRESSGNSIVGNNVTDSLEFGIYLYKFSSHNNIVGNYIENWYKYGIGLGESSNNSISGNYITSKYGSGIIFQYSSNNSISSNNITENHQFGLGSHEDYYGVGLWYGSDNNMIAGNNITRNAGSGVYVYGSSENIIARNNIADNTYGIGRMYSISNTLCNNNFVDNGQQEYDEYPQVPSIDSWDNGYPSGGNYWSDYAGVDLNRDGIGDLNYSIDVDNVDSYPLMGMFYGFNVSWIEPGYDVVELISNSSVSALVVGFWIEHPEDPNTRIIKFNVAGETGTVGFCRVCIPTALLNATYTVLLNGTEIPCTLLPCSNSTHSYLYFNYPHSTEEVIIIPEFPSFLILSPFMIVTLLTVIVHRKRGLKNRETNSGDAT